MADHSTRIAEIKDQLRSGARRVTVDGITTEIDLAALRRELRDLINDDDASIAKRRPFSQSVYLGGF